MEGPQKSSEEKLGGRPSGQNDEIIAESGPCPGSQPELPPVRRLLSYLSTALRLGVPNVARVLFYRTCRRAGIYRWLLPRRETVSLGLRVDSLLDAAQPPVPWADRSVLTEADELLKGRANYFSVHAHDIGN